MTNRRTDEFMADREARHTRNQNVIEEFRANGGKVNGPWNVPLCLLTTTGARSGQTSVTPMACTIEPDRVLVYASKAGRPENPDWFYNILKNPNVFVEVGTDRYEARAEVIAGEERDRLYAEQIARSSVFADYEKRAEGIRKIPVIALYRVG